MLCLRARGAVVRRKVASSVVLSLLPFPLWCAGFPFSLETHPIPFPLRRPPPNLLPNFSWLIGNHIMTSGYVYRFVYSIFAMPHTVRRSLCPPDNFYRFLSFKIIVSVGTRQLTRVALHSHA